MIQAFLHMFDSSNVKNSADLMIRSLVEAHPKVFHGKQPRVSPSIPVGWHGLLDEFCLLLEAICDEHELTNLRFHRILDDSGYLIFHFEFDCELSAHQVQTIDARVFSLRNRSFFTCYVCGQLVDTLTRPVLCKKHNKLE